MPNHNRVDESAKQTSRNTLAAVPAALGCGVVPMSAYAMNDTGVLALEGLQSAMNDICARIKHCKPGGELVRLGPSIGGIAELVVVGGVESKAGEQHVMHEAGITIVCLGHRAGRRLAHVRRGVRHRRASHNTRQ